MIKIYIIRYRLNEQKSPGKVNWMKMKWDLNTHKYERE